MEEKRLLILKELLLIYSQMLKTCDERKYFELYKMYLQLLVKLSTNKPVFEENQKKYTNGNCYSYALGLSNPDGVSNVIMQTGMNIGYVGGSLVTSNDPEKYLYGIQKDFETLEVDFYDSAIGEENKHGGYKIAFYVSPKDFHFIRQNIDGSWSHKVGYSKVIKMVNEPGETFEGYKRVKTLEIVKPVLK